MEVQDVVARFKRPASPITKASNSSNAPPASICIPEVIDVGASIGFRFAYTEPVAHANDASNTTPAPMKLIFELPAPWPRPSLTSNVTPASPMNIPTNTFAFGRFFVSTQLRTTTHKGSVATHNAAKLEVTYLSAHVTPPLPQSNSSAPMRSARRQLENDCRTGAPWASAIMKRTPPTVRNRVPAIRNG